ncbi:hypothetical protein T484DRAFT_3016298 [Baffinella frigidus]|nr:hypothetical protein T484DRAFT_3016298 [Cryptophyta sp. CCMP2293]
MTHSDSDHFALVRPIHDSAPPRTNQTKDRVRRVVAGLVFIASVGTVAMQKLSLLISVTIASLVLVAIQCLTIDGAFRAIKGRVVLSAIAAFGIGEALRKTGVTDKVADFAITIGQSMGPIPLLLLIFLCTACLSCVISNTAAVIILYSIVRNLHVADTGVSLKKMVIVIIVGAASSFGTPFGYQTNLMVWRSGGYSFSNFALFGVPLMVNPEPFTLNSVP